MFRKHGIDVEVIVVGGGGARVVSSLIAGDLHFSIGGGEGSVRSQLRGADTVIAASSLSKGLQRIMARPVDSSVRRLRACGNLGSVSSACRLFKGI